MVFGVFENSPVRRPLQPSLPEDALSCGPHQQHGGERQEQPFGARQTWARTLSLVTQAKFLISLRLSFLICELGVITSGGCED